MDWKKFFMPVRWNIIPAAVVMVYFILAILIQVLLGSRPWMFIYIFIPALFLSIPFWPLLKVLGLWSSTAIWDSPGPTIGGFILVAILCSLLAYLASCLIVYLVSRRG
jgi:hypothetical protein